MLVVVALALTCAAGYGTSGQAFVGGTVVDGDGRPMRECMVDRGLRLGVGFGGFDSEGYNTGTDGQFDLPVNRGANRLTFTCPDGVAGAVTTLVIRGLDTRVAVVLD